MPTSREIVQQRPLAGHELKAVILKEVEDMLNKDGMFHAHIAYRRVGYRVELKLMMDNPSYPEHKTFRESRNPPRNITPSHPQAHLLNIAAPPLQEPGPDAVVVGIGIEQVIDSPNQARLSNGLPVTVQTVDSATGQVKEREVKYGEGQVQKAAVKELDLTEEVRRDWGKGIPGEETQATPVGGTDSAPASVVLQPPASAPTPANTGAGNGAGKGKGGRS